MKPLYWILALAVVVYLLLKPRGKVGATASRSPAPAAGLGEQVGTIVDGFVRMVRSTPDSPPVTEAGDIALFPG